MDYKKLSKIADAKQLPYLEETKIGNKDYFKEPGPKGRLVWASVPALHSFLKELIKQGKKVLSLTPEEFLIKAGNGTIAAMAYETPLKFGYIEKPIEECWNTGLTTNSTFLGSSTEEDMEGVKRISKSEVLKLAS